MLTTFFLLLRKLLVSFEQWAKAGFLPFLILICASVTGLDFTSFFGLSQDRVDTAKAVVPSKTSPAPATTEAPVLEETLWEKTQRVFHPLTSFSISQYLGYAEHPKIDLAFRILMLTATVAAVVAALYLIWWYLRNGGGPPRSGGTTGPKVNPEVTPEPEPSPNAKLTSEPQPPRIIITSSPSSFEDDLRTDAEMYPDQESPSAESSNSPAPEKSSPAPEKKIYVTVKPRHYINIIESDSEEYQKNQGRRSDSDSDDDGPAPSDVPQF